MRANNNSKYNVIIADDDQFYIDIVKQIIDKAGFSKYFNIYECEYVKQGNGEKTLNILINKLNRVDIAFIDLYWENEFIGLKKEAGGDCAADIVRHKFPDCYIFFATRYPYYVNLHKYGKNADLFEKSDNDDSKVNGQTKLEAAIKDFIIKRLLFEITASYSSNKQFIEAIQGNVQWDASITINDENWTFENIFFVYKDNIKELKDIAISDFGLGHIPNDLRTFKSNKYFEENLIDYYKLLYFEYNKEIDSVLEEVSILLDYLKNWLNEINIKNEKAVLSALSVYNILNICPLIATNKSIAFLNFKEKLIIRLFFITAYTVFGLPARIIYYFFNKESRTVDYQTVKKVSVALCIKGLKFNEDIDTCYGINLNGYEKNAPKLSSFLSSNRNYREIIKNSCLKYENDFIIEYYKKNQSFLIENDEENAEVVGKMFNLWPPPPKYMPIESKNDGKFSWLHISDLHFQKGAQEDERWDNLCESIIKNENLRSCSYVFITGDVGYNGKFDEVVKKRLRKFQELFEPNKRPLFFWSFGTHDIDKNHIQSAARQKCIKNIIFGSVESSSSNYYENFKKAISPDEFLSQLQSGFILANNLAKEMSINSEEKVTYDTFNLNSFYLDKRINVCVLNTSIAATEKSEKGKLFVESEELYGKLSTLFKSNSTNPTFVLAHHSFEDIDATNKEVFYLALRYADIYLCGHEHKVNVQKKSFSPDNPLYEITAGSTSGLCKELVRSEPFNLIHGLYDGLGSIVINCYKYEKWGGWCIDESETAKLLSDHGKIVIKRLLKTDCDKNFLEVIPNEEKFRNFDKIFQKEVISMLKDSQRVHEKIISGQEVLISGQEVIINKFESIFEKLVNLSRTNKEEIIEATEKLNEQQTVEISNEIGVWFEAFNEKMEEEFKQIYSDLKQTDDLQMKLKLSIPFIKLLGIDFIAEFNVKNWAKKMHEKHELKIFKLMGLL